MRGPWPRGSTCTPRWVCTNMPCVPPLLPPPLPLVPYATLAARLHHRKTTEKRTHFVYVVCHNSHTKVELKKSVQCYNFSGSFLDVGSKHNLNLFHYKHNNCNIKCQLFISYHAPEWKRGHTLGQS